MPEDGAVREISAAELHRVVHENMELAVALRALIAAFIKHRTATHRVPPKFCHTCRESDAAIAAAQEVLGA